MSRTREAFNHGKAFVAFITCGDPDLETTEEIIRTLAASGADMIELGIPFSDPTAEGPVIQSANLRALAGAVTTDHIFDMVRRVRRDVQIPLAFMTYANVVYSYGTERFLKTASEIGMDALILPDVPFEEKDDFAPVCRRYGIDFISLIAPTSDQRISMIARDAEGFVYCVSSLGVTGVRSTITSDVAAMTQLVRASSQSPYAEKESGDTVRHEMPLPVAVGFGISTPAQAAAMAASADGVIIGSAIVRIIGEYGRECIPHVAAYATSIRAGLRGIW